MNAFSCTTATLFYLAFVVTSMLLLISTTLAWTVSPLSSPPLSTRRDFFGTAMIATTTTFLVVAVPTKVNAVEPLDDLTMPTASPTELDTDAIMAERIRRKVELQKERAQPKTFTESFQKERSKQKNLNGQTKEERRNAMCEELGRGC